jgi:malate dehydrogenase
VLVVGNPANTNAYIVSHYAPSIPKTNFTALTRLDDNRAKSLLAGKLGVSVEHVDGTIIWGNHSNTQYPDLEHVRVGQLSATEVLDQIGQDYYKQYIKVHTLYNV